MPNSKLRIAIALGAGLATAAACASDPVESKFQPECTINRFRACETDACVGSQQCVDPGIWSACGCLVLDATYAEAAPDVSDSAHDASEAAPDASSDAPSEGALDGPNESGTDAPD